MVRPRVINRTSDTPSRKNSSSVQSWNIVFWTNATTTIRFVELTGRKLDIPFRVVYLARGKRWFRHTFGEAGSWTWTLCLVGPRDPSLNHDDLFVVVSVITTHLIRRKPPICMGMDLASVDNGVSTWAGNTRRRHTRRMTAVTINNRVTFFYDAG